MFSFSDKNVCAGGGDLDVPEPPRRAITGVVQ
jgi:hypothetical protein